jgi:hypothetical protein
MWQLRHQKKKGFLLGTPCRIGARGGVGTLCPSQRSLEPRLTGAPFLDTSGFGGWRIRAAMSGWGRPSARLGQYHCTLAYSAM